MNIKNRPIVIAEAILIIITLDLVKFLTIGGVTIVNWYSSMHPFWVFLAIVLLFIGATRRNHGLSSALFWFYTIVFVAAYVNQYSPFTPILTYNCMLFNAIFAVVHYLMAGKRTA